ncbi:NAD(P)H-dependent glycerol-3-phosphate dehydrogenase [Desulfovibrio litoralis]|uniref:Glycerol-3-phosphate dehydrogenase [NAD(P)+] n=1 Tax=Desulfovibrio litoralis DSM 11393 TaxID=1121455 RepID=A0A1M7S9L8_9BACT|nr:NAD(P)H-dependent glycerol-3-phosphate dehydrogenase [Desulfovibrio litoralis]SHN55108.1 glycerol 3-phosphate dehydrogenase (NAD(P)+) [Desulfovibrio litoralis DSM 11393]
MKIAVIGGGSWGTALAQLCAKNGHNVWLWVRNASLAKEMNAKRENTRYLPGFKLADNLNISSTLEASLKGAELIVYVSPSQVLKVFLPELLRLVSADCPVVVASKGIDLKTLKPLSVLSFELVPSVRQRYAVLSGPSFAYEVMCGLPTAVSLACENTELGSKLREVFSNQSFRVYSSTDVLGVELGGALKNIIAIASGISDGLEFGYNARAALITRGLAEITRLGEKMGAKSNTFMGLSGIGDLMLTCTGDLSRNRQVGLRLAKGQDLEQIEREMTNLAEGIKTTEATFSLAKQLDVEMPITQAVYSVIHDKVPAMDAFKLLMSRSLKAE